MNTFGQIFRLTSFGESHGQAIGGVIDGVPAGLHIDTEKIQLQLDRRRPGQSIIVTSRNEADKVNFLSGIFEGRTTGTPIGFVIENSNQHSKDYENLRHAYRPSHADFTYQMKYGIRDHRGGGRSSARETASRVVAGAIAMQALSEYGISVTAYTSQIGEICVDKNYSELDLSLIDHNIVRCPDLSVADRMEQSIIDIKSQGDTVGGTITCVITGVPAGLGEPVFDKLHARLAYAMMGINAAKGFDYGIGFNGANMKGSQTIDCFVSDNGHISTASNNSGGIQGGISNGQDIYFRVAFKPVATLLRELQTVDDIGNPVALKMKGRHDPCVVPRAIPIVESMAAMVILDALLINRCTKM